MAFTNNGLTIALNNADFEFSDGTNTMGYLAGVGQPLTETRGSTFSPGMGSGSPVFKDAQPLSRMVWNKFSGGAGQALQDREFGGNGTGGDPGRYFYGDCNTLKDGILTPGWARNLVYPNSGSVSPIIDEIEIPRGVIPFSNSGSTLVLRFTPSTTIVNPYFRILLRAPAASGYGAPITISFTGGTIGTVSGNINPGTSLANYVTFKWYASAQVIATFTAGTLYTVTMTVQGAPSVFGCYIGSDSVTGQLEPYFQMGPSSTIKSYKWWNFKAIGVAQLNNGGSYNNIVVTTGSIYNASDTTKAERATTTPNVTGWIKVDNKLYVSSNGASTQTEMWNAADAAALNAHTSTTNAISMGSACYNKGIIYYVDVASGSRSIAQWDGAFPAVPSTIIGQDQIGSPNTNGQNNINHIRMHDGLMYVFKPEGVFMVYYPIEKVTTAETPRIIQLVNLSQQGLEHIDNGKWVVEHQGQLYFNVGQAVYQLTPGQAVEQINVLIPPVAIGRFTSANYVNGITTDGITLYVSYNAYGLWAFTGTGWHPITEFYENNTVESVASGLTFIRNPVGAPDTLFCGDGRTTLKLPKPGFNSSYSTQLYLSDQNKCGYWCSSMFDGDLAEIIKTYRSFVMRAFPSGFSYKVALALWNSGNPNYRTILENSINLGIVRDLWVSPNDDPGSNPAKVITTVTTAGPLFGLTTPAIFVASDFANQFATAEKVVSPNLQTAPVKTVSAAIVVYWWNPTGVQYDGNSTATDISYIEALELKYLPIQDYLPTYQMTIDFSRFVGTAGEVLTQAQFNDSQDWLRQAVGSKSEISFKYRDQNGRSKAVSGYFMNPRWEYAAPTNLTAEGYTQIPHRFSCQFISVVPEYTG